MKMRHFRWLFSALLAFELIAISFVGGESGSLGLSVEWSNGRYCCAGGTAPLALALAVVNVLSYLLLMNATLTDSRTPLPGVGRRYAAFWLDFVLAMSIVAPVVGVLPTIVEWRTSGVFAWSFVRTTPAPWDALLMTLVLALATPALVFYYALPIFRRRPSPGACMVGYQIVPADGRALTLRQALIRTLLGFVAVGGAVIAPFAGRDRRLGKIWLDKLFDTHATLLE